jgi:hypothetical protein
VFYEYYGAASIIGDQSYLSIKFIKSYNNNNLKLVLNIGEKRIRGLSASHMPE